MKVVLFIFRIHSIRLHIDHFIPQSFAIFLVTLRFHVNRSSFPYWWKTEASDFWRLQLNGNLHRLKNFKESGTNGNLMVPDQKSMVGAVRHPIQAAKLSGEWPNLCVVGHCRGKIQHLYYSPTLVAFAWWQHPIYPTDDSTRLNWWFSSLQRASPYREHHLHLQRVHLAWTTLVFA